VKGAVPSREDYFRVLAACLPEETLVVTCLGNASYLWARLRDRPENFYVEDSMGLALPLALGLAVAQPRRKVVGVEGDGGLLMHLGALVTVGAVAPRNLTVLLIQNGVHAASGGQALTNPDLDLAELARSAAFIQEDLAAIGMRVDVKTFEAGNLNQSVIRPRKYDALLFGQIINHESDLYAFWHSSQRKDPGLNVAMYTNTKVDKILEDAFVTVDEQTRIKKYAQFEDEIKKDMPAVFLYSPKFLYVVAKNLKGLAMDHATLPSDRFSGVYLWYTETDNIWKIFN